MSNFNLPPSHSLTSNTNAENTGSKKLRVVTFNYLPSAYKFVTDWIHQNGHEHILAVASPGIKSRPTPAYKEVLPLIADDVNILVTSKTKSVLTPILQQLKPDIILCFTFVHRISAEICQIPTYGVVNIHPSVLPLYRGPNPMRQFYDGANLFGATAHRMGEDYDTGEILSQEYAELPTMITQNTSVEWGKLIKKCIVNGMKKAISGESGVVQYHQQATYAAPFTEDEKWVNFDETTAVVLRKTLGLNLAGGFAKAVINGQVHKIHSANYISNFKHIPTKKAIKRANNVYEVATADGIVELCTELFDPHKKYANALPCSAFFGQSIAQQPTV